MDKVRKVVFIMTDTQRWDMCGCYRDTGLKTPNIDRLAEEGTRFEYAYTTQPVCQPARAGIFIGQYPHSCGSWANSMGIASNSISIGRRLQDYGVHTAYIGKWHLDGSDYFGMGKCPDGWDPAYWYDMRNYLEELTDAERADSRNPEVMLERDWPREMTYGHRCASRAISFLENHGEEDFFLSLSFDEPHQPHMCPPPYSSMYRDYAFPKSPNLFDTLENKPDYQKHWAGPRLHQNKAAHQVREPFLFGCNSFVDDEIGRVVEAVRRLAPDALIIYTSDHGDLLGSHSLAGKGPVGYDENTRIPLIMAGGGVRAGAVDKNPVSHINLAPTIMELMGYPIPKTLEGPSLVPQLEDPAVRVNAQIFFEFGRYEVDHDGFGSFQPMRSAYDGRYKLNINLMSTDELYDMENDPYEMVNLINDGAHAAARDRLHDAILENMSNTRDPFRGWYWVRRPWRTDAPPADWDYTNATRQREEDERYEKRQLEYGTGLPMDEAVRRKD